MGALGPRGGAAPPPSARSQGRLGRGRSSPGEVGTARELLPEDAGEAPGLRFGEIAVETHKLARIREGSGLQSDRDILSGYVSPLGTGSASLGSQADSRLYIRLLPQPNPHLSQQRGH